MSEITKMPTEQFIPELKYPKPLSKIIETYQAAHEHWRNAYAAVVAASAAVDRAPAEDEAALVASVAAGKGYPGRTQEADARVALAVAEEECRVARDAATAQTDTVRAALDASTADLVPIVLANIRDTAAAYESAIEACKAKLTASRTAVQSALSAMRMVSPHISKHYGVVPHWGDSMITGPTWPMAPTTVVRDRCEHLERMIADAKAAGRK